MLNFSGIPYEPVMVLYVLTTMFEGHFVFLTDNRSKAGVYMAQEMFPWGTVCKNKTKSATDSKQADNNSQFSSFVPLRTTLVQVVFKTLNNVSAVDRAHLVRQGLAIISLNIKCVT